MPRSMLTQPAMAGCGEGAGPNSGVDDIPGCDFFVLYLKQSFIIPILFREE